MIALHLKSLTLKGFKSFAQPTTLEFGPGITCIVGPNGSGKSNIVDALAWVMGEQGPKTLRGGKMEDVIFAGTQQLGPLGRAEVRLTIDNSDGALPIEYSEVTVGRILFRNGTSEYSINGEGCRLLDVQELLSDSGLGREMHVIVGQGQLDTVLRSDPLEIRGFIEEAAGILKFRARKEKSQRKLEAMQGNLDRLNDLIVEIKRQLRPLARQAEVAQSARDLQRELRQAKIRFFGQILTELNQKLGSTNQAEGELRAELAYLDQELNTSRLAIAELERQLLEASSGEAAGRLATLLAARNRLSQLQLRLAETSAGDLGVEMSALQARAEKVQQELSENESEVAALSLELQQQQAQLSNLEAEKSQLTFELSELASREQQLAQEREREQRQVAERISARNLISAQLERTELELAELEARLSDRNSELDVARLTYQELQLQLSQEKVAELRSALDKAESERISARARVDNARQELHALEREQGSLAAELATLNSTLSQGVQIREVRDLNLAGISGWLAEAVTIAPGMERAVSAALGSLGEAILADSLEAAVRAARQLNQKSARVQFVVGKSGVTNAELPTGMKRLADFVSAPESITQFLAGFVLASDLDEATQLLDLHPNLSFVTERGELVSAFLVSAGGEEQRTQVELVARRDSCSKSLESVHAQLVSARSALENANANYEKTDAQVRDFAIKMRAVDAEYAGLAEQTGRALARVEALESQLVRETQQLEELRERRNRLIQQINESVEPDLASELAPAATLTAERAELEFRLESVRVRDLEARVVEGSLRERASIKLEATTQLSAERSGLESELSRLAKQVAERGQKQQQLDAIATTLPEINAALDEMLEAQQRSTTNAQAAMEKVRMKLSESRQKLGQQEGTWSSARERIQNLEIAQHELRLTLSNAEDRTRIELGLEPEELMTRDTEPPQEDRTQQEKSIRSLESKLSAIGQFNPLALEEHRALSERHAYLEEQLDDLTRTRSELRKIIDELDSSMVDIFQSAFQDTAREFESLFPKLFPGGTGSLSLSDPDNPLSTGVSVNVKPAGKRIERMSLLSGGERSLAAVALLISIFKARPSPFYVLDEVEAALDDANLGRLLDAINDLGESAQLIVVTHQKRTMEVARLLYGVSMAKSGVSAVVSSRLELAS